jgi:hypothetical protein
LEAFPDQLHHNPEAKLCCLRYKQIYFSLIGSGSAVSKWSGMSLSGLGTIHPQLKRLPIGVNVIHRLKDKQAKTLSDLDEMNVH